LSLPENVWAETKRRAEVIAPLAGHGRVDRGAAADAAKRLGISSRQVYSLIRRYRAGNGLLTDIAPRVSSGGKGKTRISAEVEAMIQDVIMSLYLCRQRRAVSVIVREIKMRCRQAGFQSPSRNTVQARIDLLDPIQVAQKRQGFDATRTLRPAAGQTPVEPRPLSLVQIDHSPVDLIVVEPQSRLPIGRPYLTLAIDVYTRCILGMLVTLEAPSATSVGLCLAHVVLDKGTWLEALELEKDLWPMHGKPEKIHLDNAAEFKSEALKRGCEQHGIERDYRPKRQPHFGGVIERVIGTAMHRVHELPGTTFSSVKERGKYDPAANASLTLRELEKWLTLAIATYHGSVHTALKTTPGSFWIQSRALLREISCPVQHEREFLVDFLPVLERRIGRTGFTLDHITYYSDFLKPWIANRQRLQKFIIRRDPRDLSHIWVLDPLSRQYLEISYRSLSNPAVTLWEHRKALEKLRNDGRTSVDEAAIFRMVEKMREIVDASDMKSKGARRDKTRRAHLTDGKLKPVCMQPPESEENELVRAKRFDDIEEW
jgi:putative transposase